MTVTKEQVKAAIEIIRTVADLIRTLGEVPSGVLYARLLEPLPNLTCNTYEMMLGKLRDAGVIRVSNHLITWIGSK